MNVIVLLIFVSLAMATAFLIGFIWAVRSGQYEDTSTPGMRMLMDDAGKAPHDESAKIRPIPGKDSVVEKWPADLNSHV